MIRSLLFSLENLPVLRKPVRWLRGRLFHPSASAILAGIDLDHLARERERLAPGLFPTPTVEKPPENEFKYLDAHRYVPYNIRRLKALDLAGRPPMRVLDLGCGPGYLLKVIEEMGHQALGLDIDECEVYRVTVPLLGVRRVIHRIEPHQLLPDLPGAPFDLITAYAVCFNGHYTPALWEVSEWHFFLDDLLGRFLAPGGTFYMVLNPEHDKPGDLRFHTPELRALFEEKGATVNGSHIVLRKK